MDNIAYDDVTRIGTKISEKRIAAQFETILYEYEMYNNVNYSKGGWPDRLVQLPDSMIVAVEIKLIRFNKNDTFRTSTFRNDQAAWFAKWQRNGGKCFLFAGMLDYNYNFVGYGIITVSDWREWIKLSEELLTVERFILFTKDAKDIRTWFDKEMKDA